MHRFARRTGVTSDAPQQRYLWTDAFAVCNLLGLDACGADPRGASKALALIHAVHHTLSRHRGDDVRTGWISGLGNAEAEAHPTAGGLRIGKALPERAPRERPDPRLEWDQDGQYFHYLTRWMHALDQAAGRVGDPVLNRWARELAAVAFRAFTHQPEPQAPRRMYWKMSIDLSRPLVPAMGHHDPLDGYVTCLQLRSSATGALAGSQTRGRESAPTAGEGPGLDDETRALGEMVAGGNWATDDALGLGGLMADAYRVLQLERRGADVLPRLLPTLLRDIRVGLDHLRARNAWRAPAERRLAFRELGLAIGLTALERLHDHVPLGDRRDLPALLAALTGDLPLASRLVEFWLSPDHQRSPTWTDHQDINDVMLATALAPDGYLELERPAH